MPGQSVAVCPVPAASWGQVHAGPLCHLALSAKAALQGVCERVCGYVALSKSQRLFCHSSSRVSPMRTTGIRKVLTRHFGCLLSLACFHHWKSDREF